MLSEKAQFSSENYMTAILHSSQVRRYFSVSPDCTSVMHVGEVFLTWVGGGCMGWGRDTGNGEVGGEGVVQWGGGGEYFEPSGLT